MATLSLLQGLQSLPHSLDIPIKSEYSCKDQEDESDLWLKLETDDLPGFGLNQGFSQPHFYSFSTPSLYATLPATLPSTTLPPTTLSSGIPVNWSSGYSYGSSSNCSVSSGYSPATGSSQAAASILPSTNSSHKQQFGPQEIFNSINSCFGGVLPTSFDSCYSQQNSPYLSSNGNFAQAQMSPQMYQFFAQFQQLYKNNEELLTAEDKKRKAHRQEPPFAKRVRQTRPKVVEAKGAVQCKGRNRKKGIQCRNAALMEYIGPRPIYCAEHIELDPKSLYEKCKSPYQKEIGDGKGCKEVVLKEFGLCYKHYGDAIAEMLETNDYQRALRDLQRTNELLAQLERDAASAKKKDGDLYQRKNKLIPKFQEMKKILSRAAAQLRPSKDEVPQEFFSHEQQSHLDLLTAPQDLVLTLSEDLKTIGDLSSNIQEFHTHTPFGEVQHSSC